MAHHRNAIGMSFRLRADGGHGWYAVWEHLRYPVTQLRTCVIVTIKGSHPMW